MPGDDNLYRYKCHGLGIESDFELPGLPIWPAEAEVGGVITIQAGVVTADGAPSRGGSAWQDDPAFFDFAGIGRFHIAGGNTVIVDALPEAQPEVLRWCIQNPALGMICHQRGMLALHASAVAFGDKAVAFVGRSGGGKSTLAAHCVAIGARLISDDMLVAQPGAQGAIVVHPASVSLRLKEHALRGLGRGVEGLVKVAPQNEKYFVPAAAGTEDTPRPLTRILVLDEDADAGAGRCRRMTGPAAAAALVDNAFLVQQNDVILRRDAYFLECCRLAGRVEVVELRRRRDPAFLSATALLVRDATLGAGAAA
jgi:hypothetical protein